MEKTPPPPSATDKPVLLRPMTPANDNSSTVRIVAIAVAGFMVVNMVSGSGLGGLVVVPAMMMVIMLAIDRAVRPSPETAGTQPANQLDPFFTFVAWSIVFVFLSFVVILGLFVWGQSQSYDPSEDFVVDEPAIVVDEPVDAEAEFAE